MPGNFKPNLEVPLANSYNQRGNLGYTNAIAGGTDQKKVNCLYETVKNSATGKGTLYLVKRPGAVLDADTYGSSGQVGYLTCIKASPNNLATNQSWVFSTSGNDVRVSDTAGTTVIVTAAGYAPVYVDHTAVSGVDTVVLQIRNSAGTQRIFYSTTRATWTEITDGDLTTQPTGKAEHLDGFMLIADSSNIAIQNSDLNSLANWTAGNYITKSVRQDIPLGLAKLGQQIIYFGAESFEVFVNNGNPSNSPLITVKGMAQNYGLGLFPVATNRTHYYTVSGGRMYFVGIQSGGTTARGFYSYDGQKVEKVSTMFIDEILSDFSTNDILSVEKVGFRGHTAIAIRFTLNTAATQIWLMFFPELNEWFEWNSTVFMPINNGGAFMGVGTNQHRLYTIGNNVWADDGTTFSMSTQFKLPRNSVDTIMDMAGVIGDTDTSANDLTLAFSDTDSNSYPDTRTIDLTNVDKTVLRCGRYVDRFVKLTSVTSREVRLEKFIASIRQ